MVQTMTPLGKPLVFYLKYMAEMNRLYGLLEEGEKPDLTGVDDAEQVRVMARSVGAVAYEHVVDFLELCGKGIQSHFESLGVATLTNKCRRAYIISKWAWKTKVHVSSVPD